MSQGCKPAAISPFQSFADLCSTYIYIYTIHIYNTYIQYIYTIHIYNTYILYNYIIIYIYIYIIHAYDIRLHYLSLCLLLLLLLLSSCIMYHVSCIIIIITIIIIIIIFLLFLFARVCMHIGVHVYPEERSLFFQNIYPHPVLQVPRNRIKP